MPKEEKNTVAVLLGLLFGGMRFLFCFDVFFFELFFL